MSKLEDLQPDASLRGQALDLPGASASTAPSEDQAFAEVLEMIQAARGRALAAVNTELVDLYWRIGEHISRKLETATWGEGVIEALARYIQRRHPNLRGFTRRNLFRMKQFFEAYQGDQKVSALLAQLPWTHHLIVLGQSKRPEEREFYLRLAIRERWSKRELERQLRAAAFERAALSPAKVSPLVAQMHPEALEVFKDSYVVEFLDLPGEHSEIDLHRGLVNRLKVGRFELEHLGKLNFYLEALDRDVRKPHEGSSIGLLLCASKDDEVVEYALSRSLSPALIAEYQTQLPDKKLLQAKLHELYALTEMDAG